MTSFVLMLYCSLWAWPAQIHGYVDRAECERAYQSVADKTAITHDCIPERRP